MVPCQTLASSCLNFLPVIPLQAPQICSPTPLQESGSYPKPQDKHTGLLQPQRSCRPEGASGGRTTCLRAGLLAASPRCPKCRFLSSGPFYHHSHPRDSAWAQFPGVPIGDVVLPHLNLLPGTQASASQFCRLGLLPGVPWAGTPPKGLVGSAFLDDLIILLMASNRNLEKLLG